MGSLIKNELIKIFKKKSFYIIILVTFAFTIFYNIMVKNVNTNYVSSDNLNYQIQHYEEQLKSLNPTNSSEKESYIHFKSLLESTKLIQRYGGTDSWQYTIINSEVRPLLNQIESYNFSDVKDETKYKQIIDEYNKLIEKLDKNDWRYFAEEDLKDVNDKLKEQENIKSKTTNKIQLSQIEDTVYDLELQKQVLNWRLEKDISYAMSYENTLLNQYYSTNMDVRNAEKNKDNISNKQQYQSSLKLASEAKYDIENGTNIKNDTDARGILLDVFSNYELFIIIIVVMIAGTIVSEEFNKGTVKQLLVKPYKRSTILTSKFITCFIMLAISILLIVGMQFIVGGVIYGFESLQTPAVEYNFATNSMQEINIASFLGMQLLGKLPIYILLMTLAFALSTLFNNSAVAITLTLLGYMAAPMINQMGMQFKFEWLKFFVTPNWDLTQYFFGGSPLFEGLTPAFSGIIIVVYFVIMLIPTYMVFKKRNIKNV